MTQTTYLAHHGVKGMKWGVRKETYNSMSKSGQTKAKIDTFNKKIKNSREGKHIGGIANMILNDYRRGRIAGLQNKYEHRATKEKYKANKSKENKKALRSARKQRLYNVAAAGGGLPGAGFNITRGRYHRLRDKGSGVLKSAAVAGVTNAVQIAGVPLNTIQLGIAAQQSALSHLSLSTPGVIGGKKKK